MDKEPIFDVHQLAHVEILTPNPEGTLWFFRDLLGMEVTKQEGQSVYMRAYEDWYHHTLKITEAPKPGLGHVAWRTSSPQALERRVKALEASGLGKGWIDGDLGHGPAYRFTTPDGHPMEILWEVEKARIPQEERSPLLNRPQKRTLRGVPVKRLDHVNLFASDPAINREFMEQHLGFRQSEFAFMRLPDGGLLEMGCWLRVSLLVHELAFTRDVMGGKGRFHHVCYFYGNNAALTEVAEVFKERGIKIEAGPGKHGISQANFMYVYEPGGNRVELFGDTGYFIFDADWEPVRWEFSDPKDPAWSETAAVIVGGPLPEVFFTYGTPPLE